MARKRRHSEADMGELNLTPIMALLVILIPVLLFAFSFFEVKVQAVSAPRLGPTKSTKDPKKEKPLNLTVQITSKGFNLTQDKEFTTAPEKPIYKKRFAGEDRDEYDYPSLYSRLVAKKNQYPDEKVINIAAEFDVPWHVIARTIDAARVRLEKDSYTVLAEYSEAKPKLSSGEPVDLFPAVVFAVLESSQ
jgi:biopolymer transport protein ExbD